MKKVYILLCFLSLVFGDARVALAGDITIPLGTTSSSSTAPYTNSWFDHNTASGSLRLWDGSQPSGDVSLSGCTIRVNCYDGHTGIDYEASLNTRSLTD